jgi:hypothetical protein
VCAINGVASILQALGVFEPFCGGEHGGARQQRRLRG